MESSPAEELDDDQLVLDSARLARPPGDPHKTFGRPQARIARWGSLCLHLVALSLSAILVPYVAVGPPTLLVLYPGLQGLALLGVARAFRAMGGGKSRGREGWITFLRGEEARSAWVVGALTTLGSVCGLLGARGLEVRAWQAVEVFLLPTLLLVQRSSPARLKGSLGLADKALGAFDCAVPVVGFLVGFAALALPPLRSGSLEALVRLPVEAYRLYLIKAQLEDGASCEFWTASAVASTISSLATSLLVLPFLPSSISVLAFIHQHTFVLGAYTLTAVMTQVSLLLALATFDSPLTPTALVLPRNLLLLSASLIGIRRVPFRDNLAQMMVALVLGTGAWVVGDEAFAGLWEGLRRWSPRRSRQGVELAEEGAEEEVPHSSFFSSTTVKMMAAGSFVPLAIALLRGATIISLPTSRPSQLYSAPRTDISTWSSSSPAVNATVDLVFSYYDEDLIVFRDHLTNVRELPFVRVRQARTIVYNKGTKSHDEIRAGLALSPSDDVIELENLGREGGTYLEHILSNYNGTLASHTLFLQPHFATAWIGQPRLEIVGPETGFASFGPYMVNWCGRDDRGVGEYPFVKELYGIFRRGLCPPEGVLSSWSAQFVVSRRRVLQNSREVYEMVREMIEAPAGHWIHNGWGPNNSGGPSNPVFGHALERSWPLIFGCTDPEIAQRCPDDGPTRDGCQCFDEVA